MRLCIILVGNIHCHGDSSDRQESPWTLLMMTEWYIYIVAFNAAESEFDMSLSYDLKELGLCQLFISCHKGGFRLCTKTNPA